MCIQNTVKIITKFVEHLFLIALPVLSQLFPIGVRLFYVKIKSQSKNLRDYRSVSSHKGKKKKKQLVFVAAEKSLKNMNPEELYQKMGEKKALYLHCIY